MNLSRQVLCPYLLGQYYFQPYKEIRCLFSVLRLFSLKLWILVSSQLSQDLLALESSDRAPVLQLEKPKVSRKLVVVASRPGSRHRPSRWNIGILPVYGHLSFYSVFIVFFFLLSVWFDKVLPWAVWTVLIAIIIVAIIAAIIFSGVIHTSTFLFWERKQERPRRYGK